MSEEINNNESSEEVKQEAPQVEKVVADLQRQLDAVLAKNEELLNETKAAKHKAREEEAAREAALKEQAAKNGDYKQLFESSEKDKQQYANELQQLRDNISKEKIKSEAMRIATQIADGPNAKILSDYIAKRIKYTDEGMKATTEDGMLTVSPPDSLKDIFASDETYKSLLRGNKSSGGSATGDGGSASGNTVKRSAFDNMSNTQKMSFVKGGGKIID